MWVADAALGLCQINGGNLQNCVLPATGKPGVPAVVGQPAFDPAGFVYVPDMSTASKGIWRYTLSGGKLISPLNVAPTLGGQRPAAISFGPDGSLYVSMKANSSIMRVTAPGTATEAVGSMTTTLDGKPANGLAIVGVQLWVAESNGVLLIPDPVNCGNKCRGALNTQLGAGTGVSSGGFAPTTAIAFDQTNGVLYLGTSTGLYRDLVNTGAVDFYSGSYVQNGVPGLYSNVTATGVDNLGNAYLVDDPTLGQQLGGASIYMVPAGSPPDGLGGVPQPPPTIAPRLLTNPIADPVAQYALGSARTGAVWMGNHIWVADATAGFCKVDPTLPAPSLTACAVLPVGFAAGSPAFDAKSCLTNPTCNVYLPDTTAGGAGIVKLPFNPVTETVGPATTVVTFTVLNATAGAGATAPTSLAYGPDRELYAAMGGTNLILRITAPATNTHKVTFIGSMNDIGSPSIAFHNADLWAAEKNDASTLFNATLCKGACTAQFFPVILRLASSVTSDGTFVYIGDGHLAGAAPGDHVWRFDPLSNTAQVLATTKVMNGSLTPLNSVTGVVNDPAGNLYAVDADGIWKVGPMAIAPQLLSVNPAFSSPGLITPVTIGGLALTGATLNMPVGVTASGVTVTATQIKATFNVAAGTPLRTLSFSVTTPSGTSNFLSFDIRTAVPLVTGITPAKGIAGTSVPVTITGNNLAGATFGPLDLPSGITATGVTSTATSVTATLAIAITTPLGPASLTVTTPGGISNAFGFTVTPPPPTLTSITPGSGVVGTNQAVSLAGTFLTGATLNLPAGVTLLAAPTITATQITATLVMAATAPLGPQNITVTTLGGTSLVPAVFKINPPAPVLTSTAPIQGAAGTSVPVIVTGTNLTGATLNGPLLGQGITATGVAVNAAGTQINATLVIAVNAAPGPTSIFVTTQSTPPGLWTGGNSNNLSFTILPPPPPTLGAIAPTSGVAGTPVAVTLTGTNLLGTSAINAGAGITVSNIGVVNSTTVTASFAIAATTALGPQNVTITTPGGTSAVPVVFTIVPPAPTVTAVSPTAGVAGTTVAVTITGTNLTGGTIKAPTGITAAVLTTSATQITASFAIAATAPTGAQTFTVTTAGGTAAPWTFTVNTPPTLTSIAPATGVQGTSVAVIITGANLIGATLNLPAGITTSAPPVASATQIAATFAIAAAATTGPQNITVTTTGGTSGAVTFTVNPPAPTLASIAPTSGAQGASVAVTIPGTNLTGATLNLPAGITTAAAPVVSATQITATLVLASLPGSFSISVNTAGGASNAVAFTVVPPVPTLAGVAPSSAVVGTSVPVTISGLNLTGAVLNLPAGITAGAPPVVTAISVAVTLAIAPTATPGTQGISVTTAGGTSGAVTFTVLPPAPTLTSIAPASGTAGQSVPVTITGANLTGATLNVPASILASSVLVVSDTQITATFGLAAGISGPQNITVTTAGGTSLPVAFTINSPVGPTLAAITPASGVLGIGTAVTITGSGMTGGTLNVPAGITASSVVVVSDTQITATLLGNTFGPQSITVTSPTTVVSNALTFTVTPPPPTLTGITPASGTSGTSVPVTLSGANLTGATLTVPAGITASSVVVVSDLQITATFALAPGVSGPQTVTVTTAGGTASTTFTISAPLAPTLSSIAPASGVQGAASIPVTLTGVQLTGVTALNVPAGLTASSLVVVNDTTITANLAVDIAVPTGPQNITVTGPGGASNALTFTVNPPAPALASIAPASGAQGASVPVTITGTNLTGAALNLPAGVTTSAAPVVSATQITATFVIAATAIGPQNITVTTAGGTSAAVVFTVNLPPPALASITPASGLQGASLPVTITGTNLTGAALTLPAGVTTSAAPVVTATQITATFVIAATAATGPQNITVTTAGGTSAVVFTVNPPLATLASIAPASGVAGASVPVTITGTSLAGATAINAGAGITVSNLVVVSSTQITATFGIAAAAAQGSVNITVTTPAGTTNAVVFNVLPPPPTITSTNSPFTRGANNQGVTVSGTNLAGATAITAVHVFVNGRAVPVVVSSTPVAGSIIVQPGSFVPGATQLNWNWTLPTTLGASGQFVHYTMTVTTPSGTTAPLAFTVR